MKYSNLNTARKLSLTSIVASLILIFSACSDTVIDSVNGSDDVTVSQSNHWNANNLTCQTVSGSIDQTGTPLSGTISGDVEGTVVTLVTGPPSAHGTVLFLPGEQTWEVTGGNVESIIGETIQLEVDVVAVKPPLLRINTTARIVDGARKGNLTYHGITDLSDPGLATSHLEYHGVICP
ncbi:hypothetical protein G3570_00230 [Balneolaceae bacterium YR4-1]|uniref:Lipoprotein n=1 Tax=Halalkalibaculum roseum TaxID=2709311 RepID=A0A6M1SQH0_9BACT|nr:hypothetical protein [Halalkalibaculum roseum]NGP75040.1 hypothetical protein [Halalkalibaculum roseum]